MHHMGETTWAVGQRLGLAPSEYALALADAVLAPSPPGNLHPECYRAYEALEVDPHTWNLTHARGVISCWGPGHFFANAATKAAAV